MIFFLSTLVFHVFRYNITLFFVFLQLDNQDTNSNLNTCITRNKKLLSWQVFSTIDPRMLLSLEERRMKNDFPKTSRSSNEDNNVFGRTDDDYVS